MKVLWNLLLLASRSWTGCVEDAEASWEAMLVWPVDVELRWRYYRLQAVRRGREAEAKCSEVTIARSSEMAMITITRSRLFFRQEKKIPKSRRDEISTLC